MPSMREKNTLLALVLVLPVFGKRAIRGDNNGIKTYVARRIDPTPPMMVMPREGPRRHVSIHISTYHIRQR